MKRKGLGKGLLATSALALAIVAAPLSMVKAEAAQDTYTVQKGDCLWKIARKVYGDEKLWKSIYEANLGAIKGDYIIYSGQALVIPAVNGKPSAPAPAPETYAPASETPAPVPETPVPGPAQEPAAPAQEYVLDYNQLASWIYSGFVGTNTTGEKVILATDSESDFGILIIMDDSDRTAVSFVGPITYNNEYMTITDEANGLALTCSVTEVGDGTIALDMGDLGTATVNVQVREAVLESVKAAIEGYRHVA